MITLMDGVTLTTERSVMSSKIDVKESYKRMSVSIGWFGTGAAMVLSSSYIYKLITEILL